MSRPFVRYLAAALVILLGSDLTWADGTLTHMSGVVSVLKANGTSVPGMPGTKALVGDTVVTGTGGYVRMEMTDGGEVVLRPDSQLKIESYRYAHEKPTEDSFVFSMLKGGLRTVTGLIGKRGNRDAYELKTATATIGIRGTQFDLRVCQANCGSLADGTYLAVRFGAVQTTNAQGTLPVAAGQVAFVPPQTAPVILPRDPGIGFTPPAVIPKLDEKKKIQAAPVPAAEQAKPATQSNQTQTTQTKTATTDKGGDSESTNKTETTAKSETTKSETTAKTETKTEATAKSDTQAKTEVSVKAESAPKVEAVAVTVKADATPPPQGVVCSVE